MGARTANKWAGLLAVMALPAAVAVAADPPAGPVEPPVPTSTVRFQQPEPPTNPFLPAPPFTPEVILPNGGRVPIPATVKQQIRFSPRYGSGFNYQKQPAEQGTDRWILTGGLIVSVLYYDREPGTPGARLQEVEFATDRVVAWVKRTGGKQTQSATEGGIKSQVDLSAGPDGDSKTEVELYMAGNVVIRQFSPDGVNGRAVEQVLRAKEIYYEVGRNRAIALDGDLELKADALPESIHLTGREVWQLGPNEWQAFDSNTYSSKRPTDPNLRFAARRSTLIREPNTVRRNIFGIPYRDLLTGQPVVGTRQTLENERVTVRLADVPIFWLPRSETDINEPIGPLTGFSLGNDRIFGFQVYTTWDLFKLTGLKGPPGHRWLLFADYLNLRGTGIGTEYDYNGADLLGLFRRGWGPEWNQPFSGFTRMYFVRDKGADVLGGDRGPLAGHPDLRSRLQWRQNGDLYESGTTYLRAMAQAEYLSDTNFLEQFYKFEFDSQPNQETFLYLNGASGNAYGSLLVQPNVRRPWITETEALPRADGYLIGQSLLGDLLTYSAHGSLGYYRFRPGDPTLLPQPVLATESRDVDTGRFVLNQRLEMPLDVGPFRVSPYGVVDLAHYTSDLTGDSRGRFYGGGGAKVSTTFSRLFPDVASELFNVNGLYHKITYGGNYYAAYSDTPYSRLPQLDRLNDDATDIAYRTARNAYRNISVLNQANPINRPLVSPRADQALGFSPLFDPQLYAIRRLTPGREDTLDSIQVLQLEARQRFQTKRGFPGAEHVVDWLAVDLSMSVFPDRDRDNFGRTAAFYEYNVLWHVGDRTSLGSSGWYDPFDTGARYFNVGAYLNRPDGSNFSLIYRHTDPVDSRALTAGISYPLSRKYSVNLFATYDFGSTQNQSTQVSFARTGTDLTVLFGLSYNALVNNFGVQFAIVPNLAGFTGGQLANIGNTLLGNGGGLRQR